MDFELEEIRRRFKAESDNPHAMRRRLSAEARNHGPDAYLSPLADRIIWNLTPIEIQRQFVFPEVQRRLGDAYKYVGHEVYSCGGESHNIGSFKHIRTGVVLNLLPGGEYLMGSPESDKEAFDREKPQHQVRINPFLIGKYPVTQRQWEIVSNNNPSRFIGKNRPVERVSWYDCKDWLEEAGDGLRFPSESEWEYACRAGTQTKYFWGEEFDSSYVWYWENSGRRTHDVYEHDDKTNAFGLVDILGNVWEWCEDEWEENYNSGPYTSAPRLNNTSLRVFRGSAWDDPVRLLRCAYRYRFQPSDSFGFLGLRLARTLY